MRAVFVPYNGCAVWQVTLLQKFIKDAGIPMDTVTVDGKDVVTDGGLNIRATHSVHDVSGDNYDLCIIAGGTVDPVLFTHQPFLDFLKSIRGWLAVCCDSAALAGAAGRLTGAFTCLPRALEEYGKYFSTGRYAGEYCSVDSESRLITAKGFAHYDFMMAVLGQLEWTAKDPHLGRMALKLSKNM